MNKEGKIYALLATARMANVPSVVSNLGVGVLLGYAAGGDQFRWPWLLMVAAILFYVGGNFLNDWKDSKWDAVNRPERALPRGLFSSKCYGVVAFLCLGSGLAISGFHGGAALVAGVLLLGLIVLYTRIHKQTALSVIPMGLCRAMLPVLGYLGMRGSFGGAVLLPAIGLFLYVAGLSLSAKYESQKDMPAANMWVGRGLLIGAGVFPALLPLLILPGLGWVGVLPFGMWLLLCMGKYRSGVSEFVSALLAGIPLVDWVVLLPMSFIWVWLERCEVTDPMFLCGLLLSPFAFVLGRILQRVAPAT
ncbi:UbiA family prenyltransferase [Luteolibacter sp. AS25]|uniref:UbiA family prenyltransferase n=1 Tax=Luteolibacter sp. AS25 TaxID=3135776 RepID=UPI00398B87CC